MSQVRTVPAGETVGYGRTWKAPVESRIAVLPVGYADGWPRALSNRAHVLLRGARAPLRGRICMNLCMADVTHIPGVTAGDRAVLLGRQGEETISAELLADWLGTIPYEVLTLPGAVLGADGGLKEDVVLDGIRGFFSAHVAPAAPGASGTAGRRLEVAVCALLLEAAHADADFSAAERELVGTLLGERFSLAGPEVRELMALAEAERARSTDLYGFTRLIAQTYDDAGKRTLLETALAGDLQRRASGGPRGRADAQAGPHARSAPRGPHRPEAARQGEREHVGAPPGAVRRDLSAFAVRSRCTPHGRPAAPGTLVGTFPDIKNMRKHLYHIVVVTSDIRLASGLHPPGRAMQVAVPRRLPTERS